MIHMLDIQNLKHQGIILERRTTQPKSEARTKLAERQAPTQCSPTQLPRCLSTPLRCRYCPTRFPATQLKQLDFLEVKHRWNFERVKHPLCVLQFHFAKKVSHPYADESNNTTSTKPISANKYSTNTTSTLSLQNSVNTTASM